MWTAGTASEHHQQADITLVRRSTEVACRIDRSAIFMHLEVHMGARGTAAIAHKRNDVTATNHIANFDEIFLIVRVASYDTVTMRNFDNVAVARAFSAPANHAARHCNDIGALAASEVDALMPGFFTAKGIDPRTKM